MIVQLHAAFTSVAVHLYSDELPNTHWWVIGIAIVLLPMAIFIIKRYMEKKYMRIMNTIKGMRLSSQIELPKAKPVTPVKPVEEFRFLQTLDFSKRCICFLGGFRVLDQHGKDITAQFTPTTKSLLIFLILSSPENPGGVLYEKIHEYLWGDKTEHYASNSRRVHVSKLRTQLENIGTIGISNLKGRTQISPDENVLCDYLEIMHYYDFLRAGHSFDEANYHNLLALLNQGILLPDYDTPWSIEYRGRFLNETAIALTELLRRDSVSDSLKFKIADTLLLHDYINEDAFYTKCRILHDAGKVATANVVYKNFCKEYMILVGIRYPYSLLEVLKISATHVPGKIPYYQS